MLIKYPTPSIVRTVTISDLSVGMVFYLDDQGDKVFLRVLNGWICLSGIAPTGTAHVNMSTRVARTFPNATLILEP